MTHMGLYKQLSSSHQDRSPAESLAGKSLPVSIEAERSVLAALLLNDENVTLVSDLLKPQDFFEKRHYTIYQAILELAQSSKRIDVLTLQDHFEKYNKSEDAGGISYLLELQEEIPSLGLVLQHAKIVRDKAILRDLIYSAADIINACYQQRQDEVDVVLDHAQSKIYQISNKVTLPSFVQLNILLKNTFQHLAEIKSHHEGVTGIPTGFRQLDKLTSGMQNGDLLVLAARPSMGKTALALNIAMNAWHAQARVGIFSLEMSSEQLVLRMLSAETNIAHQKIRNALISSEEWMDLTNTAARLSEAKIFIDDTPSLSIMELKAKARKLKAQEGITFLVIDYLQLIVGVVGNAKYENRNQEISLISRSLKALAKELNIPILALSQLSRSLESRMDKRPMLSDLRESGAIEQDGDVVFFIYRDVVYNPDTEDPDLAEIIVGKQRNGPIGTVNVRFRGDITKFEN